jgi:hypothetical protein
VTAPSAFRFHRSTSTIMANDMGHPLPRHAARSRAQRPLARRASLSRSMSASLPRAAAAWASARLAASSAASRTPSALSAARALAGYPHPPSAAARSGSPPPSAAPRLPAAVLAPVGHIRRHVRHQDARHVVRVRPALEATRPLARGIVIHAHAAGGCRQQTAHSFASCSSTAKPTAMPNWRLSQPSPIAILLSMPGWLDGLVHHVADKKGRSHG